MSPYGNGGFEIEGHEYGGGEGEAKGGEAEEEEEVVN